MNLGALHGVAGEPGGMDYASALLDQALALGAELEIAEVIGLEPGFQVVSNAGNHAARAVVLAVGLGNGRLGVEGEDSYEGRGLSHCAACDGPLYRGQRVVVAGHDRWAVQEAIELADLAGQVTLVTQGASPAVALPPLPNLATVPGRVTGLVGAEGLEGVLVDGRVLEAQAVFVQWGRRAPLGFASVLTAPGLFLAGDCRPGAAEGVAAAEADGARAGAAAAEFARG
jgi:thioredoxin reductase